MNYLAHIYLGGSHPEDRVGALLGDFVKGPLGDEWPVRIAAGIRLHRHLDVVTDAHPSWRRSRDRFPPQLRRFAGIAVDLCYDHFLAKHWLRHHETPLSDFSRAVYADIKLFAALFPPRLARLYPYMAEEDWLASYANFSAVELALARMSKRSPRMAVLGETGPAARDVYAGLADDFEAFFPDMCAYVAERAGLKNTVLAQRDKSS